MARPRISPHELARPVSVTMTSTLLDRLDRAASLEAVPRSVLVREMVEDGLDRLEAGGAPPVLWPVAEPIPTPVTTPFTQPARPGPTIY